MSAPRLLLLVSVAACGPAAWAQPVQGDVKAVGFETSGGFVIRSGQWFPILVHLTVQGSQVFSGELRAEGLDLDGDRVAFKDAQVTVTPDAGAKRVWCYAVANALHELPPTADVVSDEGALITKLAMPRCSLISNSDFLVLDVSYPRIVKLGELVTSGVRDFYRNVVVSTLPAADLPDRWWGLEAVDVVIWDRPDPSTLSGAQLDALAAWVRSGGQLVVGVGANWGAIRKSALADIMPLEGKGPTVEVRRLPVFRAHMGLRSGDFKNPVAVTTATVAADAFRTLGEQWDINLITMRLVGSGRVVATAASLQDLTSVVRLRREAIALFGALFDLNHYTEKFKEAQNDVWQAVQASERRLYPDLVDPVGFGQATALRGLTAFLFVAGYIGLATLASWQWLRRRKLTYLSWTVFAGFAVAASVLSLGTVAALRGFSRGVQALSVIDLEAGGRTARGPCLFGYRSPIRQRVELSLPGKGNFLRPLARGPGSSSVYVTPARYAGVPARARLDDVLMRATLKQVEGFWHGELDGTIRGDLVADRQSGRLSAGSWLANELSVDLEGGYLLFIDPRQDDAGVPYRAAGLTTPRPLELPEFARLKMEWDLKEVPPAVNILAVRVGSIPAGERVSELGGAHYRSVDERWQRWLGGGRLKRSELLWGDRDLRTLWHEQQGWAENSQFAGMGGRLSATVRAGLLASARAFHLHNRGREFDAVGPEVNTGGLPDLDICHWLLRGQAVLLSWADDPGPARLHVNGNPRESYRGLTIYRARFPLRYTGRPPRRGGSEP